MASGSQNMTTYEAKHIMDLGKSTSWIYGRNVARVKIISYTGYDAIWSMKTTNGDWSQGVYTNDKLYWTYTPDTQYNNGNNTGYIHMSLTSDGQLDVSRIDTTWLRIINNTSDNSDDAMVYLENKNSSDWAMKINCDGYNNGLQIITSDGATNALITNGIITGYYLKSTANGNTVTIGSQNSNFTHIYNTANIPFIFNNTVATTSGHLGTASYPWNDIYIGKSDSAGIYYVGSQNTYRMIRFIDNTGDIYGNGISIGGGGYTVIGSGESADTMVANRGYTGGSEVMIVASDGDIQFFPGNNSYDASAQLTMSASRFWAGVNGNTAREAQVGVQSGAGQLYMWSHAATTGDRGIYTPAHGSGAAHAIFTVNTNNQTSFADYYNNTMTKLAFSQSGLAASAITWLACWNGYELRAINKSQFALSGHTHTMSNITWTAPQNCTCVSTANNQEWSFDMNNQHTGCYWHVWSAKNSASCLQCFNDDRHSWAYKLYGAVWNDYAEFRRAEEVEYGRVVIEDKDKKMKLCNERLAAGAKISSDTFGISIGKSDEYNMPIAVSGRVLAFPYQERDKYKLGAAVCSAPNGTVDIMTREEIMMYPERILGTVSEIPDYDIWYAGGKNEQGGAATPYPSKDVSGYTSNNSEQLLCYLAA